MSVFDRQKDKSIRPWSKWAWNPITGCDYDCNYCHAIVQVQKLYSRTHHDGYRTFQPRLWPERFDAPRNTPIPESSTAGSRNVLVGYQGDMFGDWVEKEHIETILDLTRETPQWNYIFLTKNVNRYLELRFPKNCWVGVKVDLQKEVKPAIAVFEEIQASIRFISLDPMTAWLRIPTLTCFDWVVVGPRPKTKKRPAFYPPKMWITSLAKQAKESGCKMFVKHINLPEFKKYPGDNKPRPGLQDDAI